MMPPRAMRGYHMERIRVETSSGVGFMGGSYVLVWCCRGCGLTGFHHCVYRRTYMPSGEVARLIDLV